MTCTRTIARPCPATASYAGRRGRARWPSAHLEKLDQDLMYAQILTLAWTLNTLDTTHTDAL